MSHLICLTVYLGLKDLITEVVALYITRDPSEVLDTAFGSSENILNIAKVIFPTINLLPATRAGNLSGENIPLLRGVGSVSGGQDYGVRRGCSEFHIHLKN